MEASDGERHNAQVPQRAKAPKKGSESGGGGGTNLSKEMTAKEAIKDIKKIVAKDTLKAFVKGDSRKSVKAAVKARNKEI